MKKKVVIGIIIVGIVSGGLFWGVNYLYNYAIVRGEKDFISSAEASGSEGKNSEEWGIKNAEATQIAITSDDGLKLQATQFKQARNGERPKLAIIAHGYGSEAKYMNEYAQIYADMGYDLLLPDARGHGKSEGDYIGFGWNDRLDYVKWIDLMNDQYDYNVDILLYGVSMGASTVMMTAGEKLPSNVKAIIEDCGYDTVEHELAYQLKEMFKLPAFPLIPLTSMYADLKVNYNFKEASAVKQLKKNKRPVLFIHGEEDDFVPFEMVEEVFNATKGPKEKYVVKGAGHAQAYKKDPKQYKETIAAFSEKYMK